MTQETKRFLGKLRRKVRNLIEYSTSGHDDDCVHARYANRELEALVKDHIAGLEARISAAKGGGKAQ